MLLIGGYLNVDKDPDRAPLGARSFDVYVCVVGVVGVVKLRSLYCSRFHCLSILSKLLTIFNNVQ